MVADRPTLATHLRGRSRDAVVRFVAALYDARGARTRCDGECVVVDGDRFLVVPAGPSARLRDRLFGPDPDTVDVVVALDATRADALATRYDAPALTPDDLDALARYGLDRSVADAVVRETLGIELDTLRPASQPEPGAPVDAARPARDDTTADKPPVAVPQSAVAVAVLAVTLVAVLVVAPASLGLEPSPFVDAAGADPSADAPGSVPTTTDAPSSPESTPSADGAVRLAPGLTTDGILSSNALAAAHVAAVSNRSYTWELTFVVSTNGTERGRLSESVAVAAPNRYVSTVRDDGTVRSRGPISDESSYADGERRYRRTAAGYDAVSLPENATLGRQERRARQYYRVLLDGTETTVVRTVPGEPRRYVVNVQGTPAPGIRVYTATAHVAPNGVVYFYSGSYCVTSFGRNATENCYTLTMQYRRLGETVVEAPAWYRETTGTPSPTPTDTSTSPTTTATETGTSTATPEPATATPATG